MMGINEIKKRLHHRFPFLLIDRVLELEEGKRCKALKNVTFNEHFFQGHFPDRPIMPGVLIVEAMAQTAGIAGFTLNPNNDLSFFAGFDNVKFKKPVEPGDQLILDAEIVNRKRNIWFMQATASVDGAVVCSAEFKLAMVPPAAT